MGKLAEAFVEIKVDLATLRADLEKVRQELRKTTEDGSKSLSTIGAGLRVGLGMIGLGTIKEVATGLFAAAKASASFEETLSKVNSTFGAAAGGMIDQADDLAARFGAVKKEVLDASAAFGLMGIAAGLTRDRAAEMGSDFVKLGLDIASYHDITNKEAFEKLRAGLAGEAEPLRPLGIMLSEAAVKAEAVALGLAHGKRELTDQEKILARMSVIQRQAAPAVGDLERTRDSVANVLKAFTGELKNAVVEFGRGLTGALSEGIKLARAIGAALGEAGITPATVGHGIGAAAQHWIRTFRALAPHPDDEGLSGYFTRLKNLPMAIAASAHVQLGTITPERADQIWGRALGTKEPPPEARPDRWMGFLRERMAQGWSEALEQQRTRQEKALSDLVNPLLGVFETGARRLKEGIETGLAQGEKGFIELAREQRLGGVPGGLAAGKTVWEALTASPLQRLLGGAGARAGGTVLGELMHALSREPGRDQKPFTSEVIEGQEAYATRAIQMAYEKAGELREGKEGQEKLIAVQEQAKELLGDMAKGINTILDRGIKTLGGVRPL